MLMMRPNCECCDVDLAPDAAGAMICSFECTFCAACAEACCDASCAAAPCCSHCILARSCLPTCSIGWSLSACW